MLVNISSLKKLSMACQNGYVLAVYRSGVEFGEWNGEFPWSGHENDELPELHIFNENSEYRAVYSYAEKAYIEKILDNDMSGNFTENKMLLLGEEFISSGADYLTVKEKGRKVTFYLNKDKSDFDKGIYLNVRNYYEYDENDLIYLSGYRLTGISVGEEE